MSTHMTIGITAIGEFAKMLNYPLRIKDNLAIIFYIVLHLVSVSMMHWQQTCLQVYIVRKKVCTTVSRSVNTTQKALFVHIH